MNAKMIWSLFWTVAFFASAFVVDTTWQAWFAMFGSGSWFSIFINEWEANRTKKLEEDLLKKETNDYA